VPREIVFHLGDRKTGSTAIQQALRAGAWQGEVPRLAFPAKLHHSELAEAFRAAAPPLPAEARLAELAGQIERLDAEVVVISSENFESSDPARLAGAVERLLAPRVERIRLVAYVRPHIERVVSSWAERVKLGLFLRPLDAYIERTGRNGRFLYRARLEAWRAAFGPAFTVRPMVRSELFRHDVVHDFLAFALGSHAFRMAGPVRANESLSLAQLAILAALHRGFGRPAEGAADIRRRAAVGRNLALRLAALPAGDGPRPGVPRARVAELQDYYRADAAAVDAAFLAGAPLARALEGAAARAVDGVQSIRLLDHFGGPEARQMQALAAFAAELAGVAPGRLVPYFVARRLAAGLADEEETDEEALVPDGDGGDGGESGGAKATPEPGPQRA